ncbi:leucine-rich repeat protein [Tanacetum coccineum]
MLISGIRAQGIIQHSNSRFNHHSRKSALDKKQRMKKLIDGMEQFGQDFLFFFARKFRALAEILGLMRSDGIEIQRCYLDYLEALVSHYKAARSSRNPTGGYEGIRRFEDYHGDGNMDGSLAAKEKGRIQKRKKDSEKKQDRFRKKRSRQKARKIHGHLDVGVNNFSGKLTIDFSKLQDIYKILLDDNNFHGRGEADDMKLIDSLKNCTRLVILFLSNCNFIGVLPISIVGLTTLGLGSNRFKGKIPTTIGKLQKLQLLSLYRNQFSGPIPDSIGNLSLLTELDLDSNKLEGHIPPSLGNCKNLNALSLALNRLSGKIPKQLFQLPSLNYFLDLSKNRLSGSLASEIQDLKLLSLLDLSYNNLTGTITSSLGECISLTWLNLRGNQFQGIVPSSLSSLGGLGVLDISKNNLSGKIPQFLDKWVSFDFLNLSFNDFEGEVPVVGVFANASAFSVLGNNKLCGGLGILELPKCKEKRSKKKRFPFFILLILVAPMFLIVLCCVYLLCKKKRNSQASQSSGNERFLKVSYNELLKATDGFSAENLIGEGGFNSVYKGILDANYDRFVAIKVLPLLNRGAHKSFVAECEAWRNIRHRNLLMIITSCSSVDYQGNDFKALVYEFMSNGSVHDWLHSSANTSKLNLLQRINILRDVATALDYLHIRCQTTIVHGDLKPSNILLDDDMVAHVGDFGLARLLGTDLNQNSSTGVKGTIGYAPPEYGIGSKMTSNHVIDVIDDDAIVLQSTEANAKKVEECLTATIKIGVSCSVDSPPQRMNIEIVVTELQRILDVKYQAYIVKLKVTATRSSASSR